MMSLGRRRYLLLLLYAVLSLPLVIAGAYQAMKTNANSPLDWVGGSFAPRREYDDFRREFGSGDLLVLSWPGCTLDEPHLDQLTQYLESDPRFRDDADNWYFERTWTGREAFQALTADAGIDRPQAVRRLSGTLIGPDRATTCVVVAFTRSGLEHRRELVEWIQEAAERLCGASRESQHLAGPVVDGLSVDQASQQALERFVAPSALIMLLVCWLCLRSVRAALIVFAMSLFGQGVTLALVHAGGEQMNAVLMVLPPLVQVLAVTGGIHLMNYYFSAARSYGIQDGGRRAFQLGWLPCTLSAATTAIGLASLMISELAPVRSFGLYAAAGVLVTTGLLLALVPGLLSLWPISPSSDTQHSSYARIRRERFWSTIAGVVYERRVIIVGLSFALMVAAGIGVRYVRTSVRIETLFSSHSRILQDYQWLETHVADLVPIEIVLHCQPACSLTQLERLRLIWRIQSETARIKQVTGTMSALTFLPDLRPDGRLPRELQRAWIDKSLAVCRPQIARLKYLATDDDAEQWRITAYVSARDNMDYGKFLQRVRQRVDPLLKDAQGAPLAGLSAQYTGIMPLVHEIQRQLMSNLMYSYLGAFAIIAIVMTLVQARILAGLVAMVSNVLPALIMFGAMGWTATPMDIGSIMTASVALGIAVDDTLHFLTFFRHGLEQGMDRRDAVLHAYQYCGVAMVQTSLTCGLGLSVFLLSDFVPTSRFAWLMILQLAAALAGDLVLLPAMLLTPLGRLFRVEIRVTRSATTIPDTPIPLNFPRRRRAA